MNIANRAAAIVGLIAIALPCVTSPIHAASPSKLSRRVNAQTHRVPSPIVPDVGAFNSTLRSRYSGLGKSELHFTAGARAITVASELGAMTNVASIATASPLYNGSPHIDSVDLGGAPALAEKGELIIHGANLAPSTSRVKGTAGTITVLLTDGCDTEPMDVQHVSSDGTTIYAVAPLLYAPLVINDAQIVVKVYQPSGGEHGSNLAPLKFAATMARYTEYECVLDHANVLNPCNNIWGWGAYYENVPVTSESDCNGNVTWCARKQTASALDGVDVLGDGDGTVGGAIVNGVTINGFSSNYAFASVSSFDPNSARVSVKWAMPPALPGFAAPANVYPWYQLKWDVTMPVGFAAFASDSDNNYC